MIRLIQRRLIIPRGDTGTFSIPVLAGKDTGDASILTIFDPLTHRKLREKRMELSDGVLTVNFTHGDTVNLPVGQYVWDIKFYSNPVFADDQIIDGKEVDSYYAAFTLPVCEIRETGDNLLMDDDAPQAKLAPGQIDLITAAITEIQAAKEAAVNSAAEADTSATNAESSASAAAMSASAALDSQTAATASQQGAAVSESHAAASASSAATSATTASESADSAVSSATSAAQSALAAQNAQTAAESASSNATTQATNALASAQAAANSANSATSSQQAAANSATAASQSASAAYSSETNASASAAQAGHSATTAQEAAAQAVATAVAIHEEIPTQISQLENDVGYLTEHQDISMKANSADLATVATSGSYNDLLNKPTNVSTFTNDAEYLTSFTETDPTVPAWAKAQNKPTYTAQEVGAPTVAEMNSAIGAAIGNVHQFELSIQQSLPTQNIDTHTVYLIPKTGDTNDVYDEYVYINNAWEMIGNTQIDLSNYVQKNQIASNDAAGLVRVNGSGGIQLMNERLMILKASDENIKSGSQNYKPIVPSNQHTAAFYGLAKAAGDTTQALSENAVGTYTADAKAAILNMFGLQLATDIEVQNIINGGVGA